jgi:hypothetical protein
MSDIFITPVQARNNQLYQKAKQQAVARGGHLRIQESEQRKIPLGFSRDASGIHFYGIRPDDVRTVADYQAAKAKTAALGARLCLADE